MEGSKLEKRKINRKWRLLIYVVIPAVFIILMCSCWTAIKHGRNAANTNVIITSKRAFSENSLLKYSNTFMATTDKKTNFGATYTKTETTQCKVLNQCGIDCYGTITTAIHDILAEKHIECGLYPGITLFLDRCIFPDDYLTADVFSGETYSLKLCPFKSIENKAFSQPPLLKLELLHLYSTSISELDEHTFEGLPELADLCVNQYGNPSTVEFKAFLKPLAQKLRRLSITKGINFTNNEPKIWFGGALYENLYYINFSNNRFLRVIREGTFVNLPALRTLVLSSCEIEEIEPKAFEAIASTIKELYLNNNKLIQLDVSFLVQITKPITIDLSDNDWDCSCENEDLIIAIREQRFEFSKAPICKTPHECVQWNLADVLLMCEEVNELIDTAFEEDEAIFTLPTHSNILETTTANICTATLPKTTTTTPVHACDSSNNIPSQKPLYPLRCFPPYFSYSHVFQPDFEFSVTTLTATSVEILIPNGYLDKSIDLVYFDCGKNEVITSIQSKKIITNLTHSMAYVFCLGSIACISPLNCRSRFIFVGDASKAWLSSKDKALFISLTTLGAILFAVVAGVMVYFILRFRPLWLKGCKRIGRLDLQSQQAVLQKRAVRKPLKSQSTYTSKSVKNSTDYVKYYTGSELPTMKIEAISKPENKPPQFRAPALPPIEIPSNSNTLKDELKNNIKASALPTRKVEAISKADILPSSSRAPALDSVIQTDEAVVDLTAKHEHFKEHVYECVDEYRKMK